jgi:hypothetical protein
MGFILRRYINMAKIIVCHEMFNIRRGSFKTSVQSNNFHYTCLFHMNLWTINFAQFLVLPNHGPVSNAFDWSWRQLGIKLWMINFKCSRKTNHVTTYELIPSMVEDQMGASTLMEELIHVTTTTIGGYFAIQISSQITKKDVSEIPLLRTIIPRKLLSFCDTITFAPVQSQVLRNSWTWYNHKTFPITIASIHCLRLTLHRKLFANNPSPQQLGESTQKSIGFRYKI